MKRGIVRILQCWAATGGLVVADDLPQTIITSEWSEPVTNLAGQSVRARMIVSCERSPARANNTPETIFFLEFQNVSTAIGAPLRFYFDPMKQFHCELVDASGKAIPSGGFGNGGGPSACWLTLPYGSTIRLRANMYGQGGSLKDGLNLTLSPTASWTIPAGDPKEYQIAGTFTAESTSAPDPLPEERSRWQGTLRIPKARFRLPKP